jgi:hypothetical protein
MKKAFLLAMLVIAVVFPASVMAQSGKSADGLCTNGLTGIIVTPTAMIGWDKSDIAVDGHYSLFLDPTTHVPTVNVSLFQVAQVAAGLEIDENEINNFFINAKFRAYESGGAAIAFGANAEWLLLDNVDDDFSSSIFVIATYSGEFFKMPAVTSLLFGWQFWEAFHDEVRTDFNFSMGFEMGLFPKVFQDYVYWITDFSNYSYVYAPASGINAGHRGSLCSGVRVDIIKKGNMKLQVDLIGTDLLDEDRGFGASIRFGYGF